MSICGGAGTGKTLLALEKACRLADDGQRVLLTCYNKPLGNHLAPSPGLPHFLAGSFHSVAASLAKTAELYPCPRRTSMTTSHHPSQRPA